MLLSHILPATFQAQQQKSRAKDQMNFQREMSNTAYQRQMADMRKAGLNPILAAKMGGASTPAGALAGTPNVSQTMANTVTQASQMKLAKAQADTQAQTAKKLAIENQLLGDDLKMLRKLGLSQISAKHTPSNIGWSMVQQKLIDLFMGGKLPTATDDVSSSAKGVIDRQNQLRKPPTNPEFYLKQNNRIKSLKSLGYIKVLPLDNMGKATHYFLQHPTKPNIRYKIWFQPK